MFKIVRFPSKLDSFFRPLESGFHWTHFEYFKKLVLLMGFSWGRRNITNLYRHLDPKSQPPRTRFNNFLLVDRWDAEAALAQKAYQLLEKLKPKKGETIELIIDDSKKEKRGKEMDAVAKFYDHVSKRYIMGHLFVNAVLRFRGHTIPFAIRLYAKKEDCLDIEIEFKKTTNIAAEFIRAFTPPEGVKVRVLFDSFYLCPKVTKACRKKGFHFISTIKSNRNLYRRGRKLKAGAYAKSLFRRKKKKRLTLKKKNRTTRYDYVDAGWLKVSDLGSHHVVFSQKRGDRKILGIVTDDPDLSAEEMIRDYGERFRIEVFFKDTKQLLGLGQYQNGDYVAAVTHLHLVCFAYALLTHIAIEREGAKGKRKKKAAKLSTADLQNELRRIAWEDMADYLKELPSGNHIVKELDRLLIAA